MAFHILFTRAEPGICELGPSCRIIARHQGVNLVSVMREKEAFMYRTLSRMAVGTLAVLIVVAAGLVTMEGPNRIERHFDAWRPRVGSAE